MTKSVGRKRRQTMKNVLEKGVAAQRGLAQRGGVLQRGGMPLVPHGPPFAGGSLPHAVYKPPKRDLATRIGRFLHLYDHAHGHMKYMNDSKIFAGLMVVMLNVSTKFVPFRLSRTMERFLKKSVSRNLLVFAICWVGTRDIFIAILFTTIFILFFDFLFNEESSWCILPKEFVDHHITEAMKEEEEEKQRMGGTAVVGMEGIKNEGGGSVAAH
jgi:hypothetical protein